jgi:carbonic anhydrase/acetyltransferase-like protein (isoleucine patch superfamily)
MSHNYYTILFDEAAGNSPEDGGRFAGFLDRTLLSALPLWGNFKASDLLEMSNLHLVPHAVVPLDASSGAKPLLDLLGDSKLGKTVLLGRTGNLTVLDWTSLQGHLRKVRGIVKVQVGNIPSDLYCVDKRSLNEITARFAKGKRVGAGSGAGLLAYLFEKVFAEGFERIVKCGGYSFFMRDSYEYYRENLMVVERLNDGAFVELYAGMKAVSVSNTVVGDRGVIRNSFLGNGSVVHGCVENSVIFNGVTVGRNSTIRNSVLLPSNRIGEGVEISNCLVLGGKDRSIEQGCRIGGDGSVHNGDYPLILRNGLTIIGEGITIPARSRIGSGCLVLGKVEHGRTEQTKTPLDLADGATFRL